MMAKDFISNEYRIIDSEDPVSHVLPVFEETDCVVVMRNKKYIGMLIEKELTKAKIPPKAKVKGFVKSVPKIKLDTSVEEVARLMLENELLHLPVFEDGKLVGVVKVDDLLQRVVEERFGDEEIKNFVSKDVTFVSPDDNIGKVLKVFRKKNISRLPVVEKDRVVGVITMRDVIEKVIHPEDKPEYGEFVAEKKRYLRIPVEGIMTPDPFMMPPSVKVRDVVREMIERKIGGVIIAFNGELFGIVTKKDLLEPVASYGREENVFVQFCGELDKVEGFSKQTGLSIAKRFLRKHKDFLENGRLYVYVKQHKEKKHGLPLVYCNLRLSSPKGLFVAADEGWGFRSALKNTLLAVEKQLEKVEKKG